MKLILLMRKAGRRGNLVPVQKQVTRSGKTFMQTVWVNPQDAAKTGRGGIQEAVQTGSNHTGKKEWVSPRNFNAVKWSKRWDDSKATADETGKEYILNSYGKDGKSIANAIKDTDSRNKRLIDEHQLTHELFRVSGEGESARYTPDREKLHGVIIAKMLSPGKIRTALPPLGEKPRLIMLGGRGGSGKGWFENNLYDPNKYVILDADKIKDEIPEYKGWNANQVHEESSDILEQMLTDCIRLGLNVVIDATMKTADNALAKVFRFKAAGYKTEAHYMHLPRQEAAKRAIGRFKNGGKKGPNGEPPKPYTGRYVPVTAVLKNTTNEDTFDQVGKIVDVWSFRDNNVKRGEHPILISEGKKEVEK
jgi:predicted kinase